MDVSADAIFGAVVTIGLAALVAYWKLAATLAIVTRQVTPNGGGSMNDNARKAAEAAKEAAQAAARAEELAKKVAKELAAERDHSASDVADQVAATARVEHDVANIKASQALLLDRQIEAEEKTQQVAEALTVGLASLRVEIAEDAERREEAWDAKAAAQLAESYGLLAEVTAHHADGPILMPGVVPPHKHELPKREQPTMTSGPVEPEE